MADKSVEKSKGLKAKSKAKARTNVFSCSICDETIKEPSGKAQGEDSIFYDGQCKTWLHRRCAGLSIARFQAVSASKDPFYCPACRLQSNESEISSLKADIGIFAKQMAEIQSRLEPAPPNCKASTPSAEVTNQPQTICIPEGSAELRIYSQKKTLSFAFPQFATIICQSQVELLRVLVVSPKTEGGELCS